MRASRLAAIILCSNVLGGSGCRDPDEPPVPPAPSGPTAGDDAAAITTAIRHFATQKVAFAFTAREAATLILVHEQSPAGVVSGSERGIQAETRLDGWEAPADAIERLLRRNAEPVSLRTLPFGDGVVAADLGPIQPINWEPPADHPGAKAYAHVWLPGYSADGRTAVVRFLFGPTPHGASATYLLTRDDGGWAVRKWTFVYYA